MIVFRIFFIWNNRERTKNITAVSKKEAIEHLNQLAESEPKIIKIEQP